jgi:hypothetical protein
MSESASTVLPAWSSFYVMTGSSAAALTGLMFVVITLVSAEERTANLHDGLSTFSTPTVVHFCAALLVSAIVCAPWRLLIHPAILLGLLGLYGAAYILRVMLGARRLQAYTPDREDWLWYSILPLAAYVAIAGGAIALPGAPVTALFALGGGVISLIFVGIRNAWDIVTFLALRTPPAQPRPDPKGRGDDA